jgi:hypothetical protein
LELDEGDQKLIEFTLDFDVGLNLTVNASTSVITIPRNQMNFSPGQ